MGALMVDHADPAIGGPESEEILTKQPQPHRGAPGHQLVNLKRRNPVKADQLAHGIVGPDPGKQLVLIRSHRRSPLTKPPWIGRLIVLQLFFLWVSGLHCQATWPGLSAARSGTCG